MCVSHVMKTCDCRGAPKCEAGKKAFVIKMQAAKKAKALLKK